MTRTLAVALLCGGLAVAAPVPKAPPAPAPKTSAYATLATAKVSGQYIQITGSVTVMESVMQPEVVEQNGQQVTVNKVVTRARQIAQVYQMSLQGTKASTADGKEVSEDDLAKKLGDGGAVVQAPANMDPEWKKLFADDVIFLEPKAGPQPRGGPFPGGGPAIAPPLPPPVLLPGGPGGGGPVPVLVPIELPAEKKEK